MPRADIAATTRWRAELREAQDYRAEMLEKRVQAWSTLVLVIMLLYVFIGGSPYAHGAQLNDSGSVAMSPINRYVWVLLAMMSAPILWLRRAMVATLAKRLWPLLALFAWFAMTTRWALDPGASSRRLFLYVIGLIVSIALAVGFNSGRRFHHALAMTCAGMVGIDMMSWLLLPGVSMTELGLAAIHNHKNTLGAVMLFCGIVVAPHIFAQKTGRGRFLWSVVLLADIALLVGSKSKTSLAILLVALGIMPLVLALLRIRLQALGAVAATVLLGLFGGLLGWLAWCTAQGLNPLAPVMGITFTQRTDVWGFVITEILKRPFSGSGFGSFWDIDPSLQPSLMTDFWFVTESFTNEAHNGYLDLLVTTGVFGLLGGVFVLFRWVVRGLILLRAALWSTAPGARWDIPYATSLGLFPLIIAAHNFLESSYFTANTIFGTMVLVIGVEIDQRYGQRAAALAVSAARRRKAPARRMAMITNSRS